MGDSTKPWPKAKVEIDIGCRADTREEAIHKLERLLIDMRLFPENYTNGCDSDLVHWKVTERPDGLEIGGEEWNLIVQAAMREPLRLSAPPPGPHCYCRTESGEYLCEGDGACTEVTRG